MRYEAHGTNNDHVHEHEHAIQLYRWGGSITSDFEEIQEYVYISCNKYLINQCHHSDYPLQCVCTITVLRLK